MIRVLSVLPGESPALKTIPEGLASLQKEVGGYIECVYPYEDPVCLIVNEEGKINGMELNRALRDDDGNIYDIIAGPFLVAGLTDCDFCSLDDGLARKYADLFRTPELFFSLNGTVHVIPVRGADDVADAPEECG
jgi:hypothetical protein